MVCDTNYDESVTEEKPKSTAEQMADELGVSEKTVKRNAQYAKAIDKIEENYTAPESLSFWDIPTFIDTLKKTGLSAHRYEMYWHKQIAKGGLMLAMTFLATLFCLRPSRYRHTSYLLGAGVFIGFVIYFLSDILYALGMAEKIPPFLAVWLIPLVTLMLSVASLLHIEHSR